MAKHEKKTKTKTLLNKNMRKKNMKHIFSKKTSETSKKGKKRKRGPPRDGSKHMLFFIRNVTRGLEVKN